MSKRTKRKDTPILGLKATGFSTKREAVEQGLKLLVKRSKQQKIRELRGQLKWEGDLDEMRGGK